MSFAFIYAKIKIEAGPRGGGVMQNGLLKDRHLFKLCLAALFCCASSACAREYECKDVGAAWVRLGWHVAARVEYQLVTEPDAAYEVGTGVFLWGEPRGSKYSATGFSEIEAYGLGSLVARSLSKQPLKICFTASEMEAITIFSAEF